MRIHCSYLTAEEVAASGLRRLAMQMFDKKWLGMLSEVNVTTYLNGRYMDDGRKFLAPYKADGSGQIIE